MARNPLREEFAAMLRHELVRTRVKQNVLAEYLDVTPSAVSQLLQGKITPNMKQLDRIFELLGLERQRAFELRCMLTRIRCGADTVQSPLGELVMRLRSEKGMSREQLAAACPLPLKTIELLETTPNAVPDVADLRLLSPALGCTEEELLGTAGLDWRVRRDASAPVRDLGGLYLRENTAPYNPGPSLANALSMKYRDFLKRLNAFEGDIYGNRVAEAAGVPADRPLELIARGSELDLVGGSAWKLTIKSMSTLCSGELALVRTRGACQMMLLLLDSSRTNLVGRKLFRKSNKSLKLSEELFDAIIPVEKIEFIPHGWV
ncbi:MAG: helix-turn-helix domain-containing protein [Victivallaceae bacterium]|nr:helix-turn-helix domain-containing protein [Victivallaceae bacterium]